LENIIEYINEALDLVKEGDPAFQALIMTFLAKINSVFIHFGISRQVKVILYNILTELFHPLQIS